MASWLKGKLFGRQLSHGSDKEDPQSFEEAFQVQQMVKITSLYLICLTLHASLAPHPTSHSLNVQQTANVAPLSNISPPMPSLDASGGLPQQQLQMPGNVAQSMAEAAPGATEMSAAYQVS